MHAPYRCKNILRNRTSGTAPRDLLSARSAAVPVPLPVRGRPRLGVELVKTRPRARSRVPRAERRRDRLGDTSLVRHWTILSVVNYGHELHIGHHPLHAGCWRHGRRSGAASARTRRAYPTARPASEPRPPPRGAATPPRTMAAPPCAAARQADAHRRPRKGGGS